MRALSIRHLTYFIPILLILSAVQATAPAQSITHQIALPSGESWCSDSMINDLFNQINAFRTQNGAGALKMDTLGMKDAEIRATQFITYMTTHSITDPGFNPHEGYSTTAASLGYDLVSENLAYMNSSPGWIVYAGWQDTLHLNALLAGSANVMGVSCVFYNGIPFWTYEPGRNASAGSPSPTPTPTPTPTPAPTPTPGGSTPTLDSDEAAFLTLINNFRAQNGAGALQVSAALQNSSVWMSNDMATNNIADHTDSLGRDPHTRMAAFGYPYSPWGENILGGYSDAQSAFNGWMTACDPDATGKCTYAHRQNMLYAGFKVIGIGRVYNPNSAYRWYWTTDFGGVVDATINPTPGPSGPTITSFTATPSSISAGQSSTLSWSVAGATTISIDNGVGSVTSLTTKAVSPAQTTTYTLTATNSGGSATARVTVTIRAASDTQAPTAPAILSAIAKSPTEVDVTWSGSTDNVGVTGYQILRGSLVVASVSSGQRSYADTNASPNSSYTYFVRAFDAAGNMSASSNGVPVTTIASPISTTCSGPASNAFTGCYYPNTTLSGNPTLVRTDSQINFMWGNRSPDPSLTPANFSIRWQGNFSFGAGTYLFNFLISDGVRFYIDGKILLDIWTDRPAYGYSVTQALSQGNHLIVVEYYEHTNGAVARVWWQQSGSPAPTPSPTPSPSPSPGQQAPVIATFNASPSSITAGQPSTLAWNVSGATSLSIDNGVGSVTNLTSRAVFPSQTTTYTLTATGAGGSRTAHVTVTVSSGSGSGVQPLTTPTLTSAVAKSSNEVDLTWTPSTGGSGITGYQVLCNGLLMATVPGSATSYVDRTVGAKKTYEYTIRAFDGGGRYSRPSNTIAVQTP